MHLPPMAIWFSYHHVSFCSRCGLSVDTGIESRMECSTRHAKLRPMDVVYKGGIWLFPRALPLHTYTHAQAGICGGPFRATTPRRSAISNLQVLGRDEAQKLLMRVREAHWPAIKSRGAASLGQEMAKLTLHTFTSDLQRRVEKVSK